MKRQDCKKSEENEKLKLQYEEDRFLWKAMKAGDPLALKKIFNKYYADLFFYGSKLEGNKDKSPDTIQDLFANIWENRKKIKDVVYLKAYLFTSLRNNLLKTYTKDIIDRSSTDGGENSDFNFDISPEEIYLDNETIAENVRIIEELLVKLSPKQKEIIYLKFYGNYSNSEISEIISIKQQSVANLLARTIKTLQKEQNERKFPFLNVLISGLL